jgi:hypothetical protein
MIQHQQELCCCLLLENFWSNNNNNNSLVNTWYILSWHMCKVDSTPSNSRSGSTRSGSTRVIHQPKIVLSSLPTSQCNFFRVFFLLLFHTEYCLLVSRNITHMRRPLSAGVDPPVIYLITIPHFSVYAVVEVLIISSPLLIALA